MLTQILTFLIFFAVIGCILYGRRLIRTEKVDAVFGNPERALGGTHWVIVGSSFLLLVWLYYSWDIAKGRLYSLCIRPGRGAITYSLSPSNKASSTE